MFGVGLDFLERLRCLVCADLRPAVARHGFVTGEQPRHTIPYELDDVSFVFRHKGFRSLDAENPPVSGPRFGRIQMHQRHQHDLGFTSFVALYGREFAGEPSRQAEADLGAEELSDRGLKLLLVQAGDQFRGESHRLQRLRCDPHLHAVHIAMQGHRRQSPTRRAGDHDHPAEIFWPTQWRRHHLPRRGDNTAAVREQDAPIDSRYLDGRPLPRSHLPSRRLLRHGNRGRGHLQRRNLLPVYRHLLGGVCLRRARKVARDSLRQPSFYDVAALPEFDIGGGKSSGIRDPSAAMTCSRRHPESGPARSE